MCCKYPWVTDTDSGRIATFPIYSVLGSISYMFSRIYTNSWALAHSQIMQPFPQVTITKKPVFPLAATPSKSLWPHCHKKLFPISGYQDASSRIWNPKFVILPMVPIQQCANPGEPYIEVCFCFAPHDHPPLTSEYFKNSSFVDEYVSVLVSRSFLSVRSRP